MQVVAAGLLPLALPVALVGLVVAVTVAALPSTTPRLALLILAAGAAAVPTALLLGLVVRVWSFFRCLRPATQA